MEEMSKKTYDFYKEYGEVAGSLAIYPGQGKYLETGKPGRGVRYVCFKLIGEIGEFSEKMGKVIRDNEGVIDVDRKAGLLWELGDILWYCNALCREYGKKFAAQVEKALTYPTAEHLRIVENKWPLGTGQQQTRQLYLTMVMARCASEITNNVLFHEGAHPSSDTDNFNIFSMVQAIIAATAIFSGTLGNDLQSVAKINLDKLTSRRDRGKLQGEGDKR